MFTRYSTTVEEENLIKEIVDCAYRVHVELGPGLLEKIYEICFCHELRKKKINFISQVPVKINYDGLIFDEGFRIDVLVENKIVCEIKSSENKGIFEVQLLSHLKLAKKHLGLLINFKTPLIKDGIKRFIV